MKVIKKLKLRNFKKFNFFEVEFNNKLNILVGDNESGKSSIIEAINLVLSGSRSKIESIGLEHLFNTIVINNFLSTEKKYEDLPILSIEVYFNEQNNFELSGINNSDEIECDGLRLEIAPNEDFSRDIKEVLLQSDSVFPFEFYNINFHTFSGSAYSGYKKYFRHILIDNSQISSEYAIKEYIKEMYNSYATPLEKNSNQNEYRKHKEIFTTAKLSDLNNRVQDYKFSIKNSSKSNLESDLTLSENGVYIENKGKGIQCFIKTKFALSRTAENLDIVLIEEPENHLSHLNMKKLIKEIEGTTEKQLFISTHSNLISSRLDLRNCILLNSTTNNTISLNLINEETAKFFIKAPDNNILEFVLSKKIILVEGDAEFLLMSQFYKNVSGTDIENSDVHIISVDGTSFKRYLEIAKSLELKTAVIRDNDGNYDENCIERYRDYTSHPNIRIFSENDNNISTFEISLYQNNTDICNELFQSSNRRLSIQEYMLKNKTDVAFKLLENKGDVLNTPQYIIDAIVWINN